MLLKLLLWHLLVLLVQLKCLRSVLKFFLHSTDSLIVLSSIILGLHHTIRLLPVTHLLLHIILFLLLSHLSEHVVIGVLGHGIHLVLVFVLGLLLLGLVLDTLLAVCTSCSCHISTVVLLSSCVLFISHVLVSLVRPVACILLPVVLLAIQLLLLHLLNLLLECLLHVQTQPGNNLLLLIDVFHVQEVLYRLIIVQKQELLEGVRSLFGFQGLGT